MQARNSAAYPNFNGLVSGRKLQQALQGALDARKLKS
jgi:hypothetical protein